MFKESKLRLQIRCLSYMNTFPTNVRFEEIFLFSSKLVIFSIVSTFATRWICSSQSIRLLYPWVFPSSWPLKCSGRQKLAAQIKRQIVAQLPVWKKDSGTLNVYWLFETHLWITQSIIIRSRVTFMPFCRTNFEEKAYRAYHNFGGFEPRGRLGGGYSWKNITKPTKQHFFLVISLKMYFYSLLTLSLFLSSPFHHNNQNTFTEIVLNRIVALHWRTIQQLPIMS